MTFFPDYSGTESKKNQVLLLGDRSDPDELVYRVGRTLKADYGMELAADFCVRSSWVDEDGESKVKKALRRVYSDSTFAIAACDTNKDTLCRTCVAINHILKCGTPVLLAMGEDYCQFPLVGFHNVLHSWPLKVPYDYNELLALAVRAALVPDWIASYEGRALRMAQGAYQSQRRILCPKITSTTSPTSRQRSSSLLSPLLSRLRY